VWPNQTCIFTPLWLPEKVPLKAFHGGKYSPNQITRRYRIFERDVLCYFIVAR
jgi:hypothetical protein